MQGAIYILSRKVIGDRGESYMQNVTVFASSAGPCEKHRGRPVRPSAAGVRVEGARVPGDCRRSPSRRSRWTSTR